MRRIIPAICQTSNGGLVLTVVVHGAEWQDQHGAEWVMDQLGEQFCRLKVIFGDAAYGRSGLPEWANATFGWVLQTVLGPMGVKGFVVLPKRWIVERTFAWLARYRRHSKDYERTTASAEAFTYIAMIKEAREDLKPLSGHVLRVTSKGITIVENPSAKFWRPDGMFPLPDLVEEGNIEDLKELVNIREEQFPLLVSALIAYLMPVGPYPVTVIGGEQGAAKSTLAKLMRMLVDPHECMLRSEPKDLRSLMVSALNNWVLTFDNLSRIPQWESDAFCRLATGGGFCDRKLYTDGGEYVISAQRPVIITGIGDVVTKPDLVDRSLMLELDPISSNERVSEQEYWEKVDAKLPSIFRALLIRLFDFN